MSEPAPSAATATAPRAQALAAQAVAQWKAGHRADALAGLRQAFRSDPTDMGIAANLARAELLGGRPEWARRFAVALASHRPGPLTLALPDELQRLLLGVRRPSALAGLFYAADPAELSAQVDTLLDAAPVDAALAAQLAGQAPKALVLPHAGHRFSGAMAARGLALLRPHLAQIRRIVLLGPTHRLAVAGAALPGCGAFVTPLGAMAVDTLGADALADLPFVQTLPAAHEKEHDIEVQLPLLQRLWARAGQPLPTLLPLLLGRISDAQADALLQRLWGASDTLLIVSTDLSHYHAPPAAEAMDQQTCQQIIRRDSTLTHQQACGATPLNALLRAARRQGLPLWPLGYTHSGLVPGVPDSARDKVVGYASFAMPDAGSAAGAPQVDAATGEALLHLARAALQAACEHGAGPLPETARLAVARGGACLTALQAPGAVFVTLTQQGRLRGCIGSLQAHRPLEQDVWINAQAAALRDARFAPVSAAEAPGLRLEVSLLGPAQPVPPGTQSQQLWRLCPGQDGVILSCQHQGRLYRSTFLPQVWDTLPDVRVFMAQLKRKAGLPADFWSDQMQLQTYRVHKLREAAHDRSVQSPAKLG